MTRSTAAARAEILSTVKANRPSAALLPEPAGPWITYPSPVDQFREMLLGVGGHPEDIVGIGDLPLALESNCRQRQATRVCSFDPSWTRLDLTGEELQKADTMSSVDITIVRGHFGVAENGAIWLSDSRIGFRPLLFLCEHLFIVLPVSEIVAHMHEAYRKLDVSRRQDGTSLRDDAFGVFVSGPSKTADIEQALVIGAQGPRSLTVFLLRD